MKVTVLSPAKVQFGKCFECPICQHWNTILIPVGAKVKGTKTCWYCEAELEYSEDEDASSPS